jgi:arabinogalactan oligomer / maltooligosaccharide transport system permease protein
MIRLNASAQGVLAGILVMLAGMWLFAGQTARDLSTLAKANEVAVQADGLGRVISAARTAGQGEAQLSATAGRFVGQVAPDAEPAFRIVRLDDRALVASSVEADLAHGALPRRLRTEEKPLYDFAAATRVAAPAEGLAAPVALGEQGGRASAAQAWRDGAEVSGHVEVSVTGSTGAGASSLMTWALLSLVGGAALGLLLSPLKTRRAAWAAMAVVAAAAGFASNTLLNATSQLASAGAAASDAARERVQEALTGLAVGGLPVELSGLWQAAPLAVSDDLPRTLIALTLLALATTAFFAFGGAARLWETIKTHRVAYAYVAPAIGLLILLSFFPFFYGVILSFTDTTLLNQGQPIAERFNGLDNYIAILSDTRLVGDGGVVNYQNFYWTLGVTILWTVTNVIIGVGVGLALALLLNVKGLKFVGIYRTLLILPWAIPNYITALTWKGLFHPQFGSFNALIQAFGGQPIAWFDTFWPSFVTGLATNGWLSFPFMMVVCLGALQAIDEDMYEAARIDGANAWQRFWHITLPSLKPALLPAVIVSVVWTFNMFNVIYLVSAGQPSGATEILVTRAYKVAFEEYRYGYAAAYSVVIFLILLMYGIFQIRATKATEGAR